MSTRDGHEAADAEVIKRLRERVAELEQRIEGHERGHAELRASQRVLRMVMDTIPMRIFWKDRNYRFLGCNRVFAEDAGVASPEELVGRTDFECVWKEVAHLYRADDVAVIEEHVSKVGFEEPQSRADGTQFWLRTTKVPLRDEHGEVIGMFGCYDDITEQRLAMDRLRASEERHRSLVEQASDGIFVFDEEGRFVDVNPAGCAMLGRSAAEICKLSLRDMLPDSDLAEQPIRWPDLRSGKVVVVERRLKRGDGSLASVEIGASALPDGHFEAIVRDTTERNRLEQERHALEEERRHVHKLESIGRLAGGVAHDFNNLLTVIMSHTQLLTGKLARSGADTSNLDGICEAAKRASALTAQLLAFSRKQVLNPQVIELNAVIGKAEGFLSRILGEDVTLTVELTDELGYIRADPTQIEQIILNLASNARDAMPRGGRLSITTENEVVAMSGGLPGTDVPAGEWVSLVVADTGVGMDEETLAHVFDPFFTTKPVAKGTGLGLSSVYGIVKQSGGHINVRSAPGQGTDIIIRLPRVDAPLEDTASAPSRESAAPIRCATILLVEDDRSVRDTLAEVLSSAGHEVIAVEGGEAALQVARDKQPEIDLVISDVVMPGMSGVALAERLHHERPELKVVLMSGYSEQLVVGDNPPWVHPSFVQKPVLPAELLRRIDEALD